MKNAVGIEIPNTIEGLGTMRAFDGKTVKSPERNTGKIVTSLEKSIELSGLKNGMTISFHHHFRNGDYIVNMVLDVLAKMGFKDLVVAASSLTDIHEPMIQHIKNGLVKRIETSGLRGELANEISKGLMDVPVVFRSHGGRAAAIVTGEVKIDVAFLGVPSSDLYGNANGYSTHGDNSSACGSLGYARVDAKYAQTTILLTNNIVPFPNTPCDIPQTDVDYIVEVEAIGDPKGIASGATRITTNPRELMIAQLAAEVMEASGYLKDGFSFQTGTGGASLAVSTFLKDKMVKKGIKAGYALGGITGHIVKLHEEGLIDRLLDVQSFDLTAVESIQKNPFHFGVDANYYATPNKEGAAVDHLDIVVLSALEVDVDFNVNVLTGSDGIIRGAVGGHPDTSAGANMSIIVAPLVRGRIPTVLDRVNTIVTPGSTVDVFVTDHGIAVNPKREDLLKRFTDAKLPIYTMNELKDIAEKLTGTPAKIKYTDKIVGVVNYRDSSIIDIVRQIL